MSAKNRPAAKKPAKHGDIRTLVHIDNPDDAEIAASFGEGDSDTLVAVDNPDDAEVYPPEADSRPASAEDDGVRRFRSIRRNKRL